MMRRWRALMRVRRARRTRVPDGLQPELRVLLVSEGKHEQAGALLRLLERCCQGTIIQATHAKLSDPQIKSSNGASQGTMKRAIRWAQHAEAEGFQACVVLLDEDGSGSRVGEMDAAQESPLCGLPRAMGVAVRTFDAWMLADETAVSRALGRKIQRQKDPEKIKNAKDVFEKLLGNRAGISQAEAYASIAATARLTELEARCPVGFQPFTARLRALGAAANLNTER